MTSVIHLSDFHFDGSPELRRALRSLVDAAPLIELLKSEGFQSTMERRPDGAWAVNFWRE